MKTNTMNKRQSPFPRRPSVILSENMRTKLKIVQNCRGDFSNSDTLRYVLKQGLDVLEGKRS